MKEKASLANDGAVFHSVNWAVNQGMFGSFFQVIVYFTGRGRPVVGIHIWKSTSSLENAKW